MINRQEKANPNQLWTLKKQARVCSVHFVDERPS